MKTTITKLQDGKEEKKRRRMCRQAPQPTFFWKTFMAVGEPHQRMWGWKRIKLVISSLSNHINHQTEERREEKEEDVGRKRIKLGISNLAGDGSN